MTVIVRDAANVARTIAAFQVRDGGNVARNISEIRVRDSNNVSRIVYMSVSPLTGSISPNPVSQVSYSSNTIGSPTVTATPSGGLAPYTYSWTLVSWDNPISPPTITSNTAAMTSFIQANCLPNETSAALFRCTIIDSVGQTATPTVDCYWTYIDSSIPP